MSRLIFVLTGILVILKGFHWISWGWWWVFAPAIIYYGTCFVILALMGLVICYAINKSDKNFKDLFRFLER